MLPCGKESLRAGQSQGVLGEEILSEALVIKCYVIIECMCISIFHCNCKITFATRVMTWLGPLLSLSKHSSA